MNITQLLMITPQLILLLSVVIFLAACYALYLLTVSGTFNRWLGINPGEIRQIILQRSSGVVFFGIVPLIVITLLLDQTPDAYGLKVPSGNTFMYALLFGLVILPVNYFSSRSPGILTMYPQIREKTWSLKLIFISSLTWILYLTAYEFLFRGFILFIFLNTVGTGAAIAANLVLYSLFHIHKGWKEMLGSLPFGIVACYFTIITGNIWFAVILHCILALTNEWFAIYRNPSMTVKFPSK